MSTITLAWLHERCRDEDGHLIWLGTAANGGRDPRAGIRGKTINIRRAAWSLAHGGRAPRDDRYVVCGCGVPLCVRPRCMVEVTRSARRSGIKFSPEARARFTRHRRARAKASPEIAAAVRASTESSYAVGRQFGLHPTTVQAIRRGKTWVDHTNPFAGLMP